MTDAGEDRSPIPEPVAPREYLDLCPGCAYRLKGLPMVHNLSRVCVAVRSALEGIRRAER